ncbi:MAG TPA: hypothetical protein PLG50_13910 [bacterium]|nr:hypothetical protein [bacterium]HQG46750.1 hypothetical protein [bacterium]HQI47959.1 hypothetical protein [bacterium]HQJ64636.1 hypothetical protein [bacterium]
MSLSDPPRPANRRRTGQHGLIVVLLAAVWLCTAVPGLTQSQKPAAPAAGLPGAAFFPGWGPCGATRTYVAQNLYGYIDGGAELFLEFGFAGLTVQRYCRGEAELTLDLYRMASPDAALGIYLARKGVEQPVAGIECRNTGSVWQIAALRGRYYIQITNLSGVEHVLPVMVALLQKVLVTLPDEPARDWLAAMPAERIPGSELLIAGPYSLQPLCTLGEGDVLQLGGRVMGVAVERPGRDGQRETCLRFFYPDSAAARSAFTYTATHLDPYLSPVHSAGDTLLFRDFQQEYGRITCNGSTIQIELHLPQP